MAAQLKVSVLSSGAILVDGKPVDLADLDRIFSNAKQCHSPCSILYYREDAQSVAPLQSVEVVKTIIKHQLPVSLCSQPDFSDYVDRFGQSRPRTEIDKIPDLCEPHAPDVYPDADIDKVFDEAREEAWYEGEKRIVVIVRPDRGTVSVPAPEASKLMEQLAQDVSRIASPGTKQGIAVIANTAVTLREPNETLDPAELTRAIPLFSMLLQLAYIGHAVWIFEGHPDALHAGCRDADLLLVDSGMEPFLIGGWAQMAASTMRNPRILIHDRETLQLRDLRESPGCLDA